MCVTIFFFLFLCFFSPYSFAHSTHASSCGAATRTTLTSAKPRRAPPLTAPSALLEKLDRKYVFHFIFFFQRSNLSLKIEFCASLVYDFFLFFPPAVVLQRSLHVEEPQPGEAGRSLGFLEQVGLLLSLLRNRRSLPDAAVQQPSVSLARWHHLASVTCISRNLRMNCSCFNMCGPTVSSPGSIWGLQLLA